MPIFASIRLRLTLWYVLLLAGILGAFIAGVYLVLRQTLYDNLDESLENQIDTLLNVVQFEEDRPFLPTLGFFDDPEKDERFVRVFDISKLLTFDGSTSVGQIPLSPRSLDSALLGMTTTRRVTLGDDDDVFRVKTVGITRDDHIVGALEVGQSEEDVSDTRPSRP